MITRGEKRALEQKVRPWLDEKRILYEVFRRLPPRYQIMLYKLVYEGQRNQNKDERKELYRRLHPQQARGEGDQIFDDAVDDYFRPMSPSEKLPYLYKF